MPKKDPKNDKLLNDLNELTADLQRTRADFENYRKRIDAEKEHARSIGKSQAILKLLPVVDNIERAVNHMPEHLTEDKWAQGVTSLAKNLDKALESLDLHRIDAKPGTPFDPELHEAIQMDDSEGETEVVAEELQSGYKLGNDVIRHSMVKVTRQ
jgi:molecular chaperone GrpE